MRFSERISILAACLPLTLGFIWAYLGTIPPIVNHVPDPIPPAGAPPSR